MLNYYAYIIYSKLASSIQTQSCVQIKEIKKKKKACLYELDSWHIIPSLLLGSLGNVCYQWKNFQKRKVPLNYLT